MTELPITRASLLVRLRETDDREAWTEFVQVYGPAVFGYARRRGLQEADAADLTQDVFRAVAGVMSRFDYQPARGSFRGWLFTIVQREWIRQHHRQRRLPITQDPHDFHDVGTPSPDAAALWDASVERQLFAWALEQVRDLVSDTTYQAFCLTAIDDLPGDVVASRLGISRGAVYLARGRVLARMRELIADLESEGGER